MTFGKTARLRLMALASALIVVLAPRLAAAQRYDLDFTLPTAGKSGCLVCHGDPNLVRLKGSSTVSFWVSEKVIGGSAHAKVPCTGCHLDFAYKSPHGQTDWRRSAKLSCKNCHSQEFDTYAKGVHSISVEPGQKLDVRQNQKPLCGDCHGAHDIARLTDDPKTANVDEGAIGKAKLHADGYAVCGNCHQDYWKSYSDYYHGSAYKRGAPDAPACWQCHGAHEIYPSTDKRSMTAQVNLVDTCGQCHASIGQNSEQYVSYAGLVHRRRQELDANPVYAFIQEASKAVTGFFGSIRDLFT